MQTLVGKKSMHKIVVLADKGPRFLRLVQLKFYGTEVWAILDSKAVPDVISA